MARLRPGTLTTLILLHDLVNLDKTDDSDPVVEDFENNLSILTILAILTMLTTPEYTATAIDFV